VHIYVVGPKLQRWNFIQISQLSIWSGVHKLFRNFWTFRNFLPQFGKNCGTTGCPSEWAILSEKKRWKQHQNGPINSTILVQSMSPLNEQCQQTGSMTFWTHKHFIFAPTAGTCCSICTKRCNVIGDVETILKDPIIFRSNASFFPQGARKKNLG